MADPHNVNNQIDMTPGNTGTPVGNSIESARRVLYPSNVGYNVPVNSPAIQHTNLQQKLSFSNQPPSPHDTGQQNQQIPLEFILNEIYSKLHTIDAIPSLLGNLEALPLIDKRLEAIENRFSKIENEIMQVKHDVKTLDNRISNTELSTANITQRVNLVEQERDRTRQENMELREKLIDVQSRSMRENLLFGGIEENEDEKNDKENIKTEQVLKDFIKTKLNIKDDIQFHVVYRLRPRNDRKPRTIVAKFERRKDRNQVLRAAPLMLRDTSYSVYEQFPHEIIERRSILYPVFKREQRLGKTVRFREDKLFVNGQRVYPEDVMQTRNYENRPNPTMNRDQGHPFLMQHFGPPAQPPPEVPNYR